jgi:phosphoglycolate phosphatase-like HAD superfamily hydrolase
MDIIPSARKIGVALDVDGTLVDSNRECYKRTSEAWMETYRCKFPLTYEEFYSFRPKVKKVQDYFNFSADLLKAGGKVVPEPFYAEALTKLFYSFRAEKQAADMKAWLAENPAYEGIPEMMAQLKQTLWDVFVVTAKDRASVNSVLGSIDCEVSAIYDKDIGGRDKQFAKACVEKSLENTNIVTYDDIVGQLVEAKKLGVTPVWAPQGYGIKADAESGGFVSAWPVEFVPLVEKIFSSR